MSDIHVPQMGKGIGEAKILKWLKQSGDRVEVGEPIAELETDKVNVEVVAEESGFLQIHAAAGSKLRVGQNIARIVTEGDDFQPLPMKALQIETTAVRPTSRPDLRIDGESFWLTRGAVLTGKTQTDFWASPAFAISALMGTFTLTASHKYLEGFIALAIAVQWFIRAYRQPRKQFVEILISATDGFVHIAGANSTRLEGLTFTIEEKANRFNIVAVPKGSPSHSHTIYRAKREKDAKRLLELTKSAVNASSGGQWPPSPRQA